VHVPKAVAVIAHAAKRICHAILVVDARDLRIDVFVLGVLMLLRAIVHQIVTMNFKCFIYLIETAFRNSYVCNFHKIVYVNKISSKNISVPYFQGCKPRMC